MPDTSHGSLHPASAAPNGSSDWPRWLADPTSIPFFHAADFWIGVIALGITLATFVLGWRKLVKVQAAAELASKAVSEMKLRVSRYDATVDAAEGLYSFREMARQLDGREWRPVVRSMSDVRKSIIRIDNTLSSVDEGAAKELRRAANRLDKHIRIIEEALSEQSDMPPDHGIRASIRAGEEALEKAKRRIEEIIS